MTLKLRLDDEVAERLEKQADSDSVSVEQLANEVLSNFSRKITPAECEDSEPWNEEKNERRIALIDKKIQGELSEAETFELENLQQQAIAWRDSVSGPPLEAAKQLHAQLLKKAGAMR